jgi:protein gp37
MGAQSKIQWTDNTFNPWIGCSKVSAGCANCYAERENSRRKWNPAGWGKGAQRKRTSDSNWHNPRSWNRTALTLPYSCDGCGVWSEGGNCFLCGKEMIKRRPRVFCASLADWLDEEVPYGWLLDLLMLIAETDNLDWLLLTKRPQNWLARLRQARNLSLSLDLPNISGWIDGWLSGEAPSNVWLGVSVENQKAANLRIPELLSMPAAVRFLSCEPLLGQICLEAVKNEEDNRIDCFRNLVFCDGRNEPLSLKNRIDWVICGGESGPKARPMQEVWAIDLLDQCREGGIPFFFKQWGEHDNGEQRVGKAAAGRLLMGREWNEMPQALEVAR